MGSHAEQRNGRADAEGGWEGEEVRGAQVHVQRVMDRLHPTPVLHIYLVQCPRTCHAMNQIDTWNAG